MTHAQMLSHFKCIQLSYKYNDLLLPLLKLCIEYLILFFIFSHIYIYHNLVCSHLGIFPLSIITLHHCSGHILITKCSTNRLHNMTINFFLTFSFFFRENSSSIIHKLIFYEVIITLFPQNNAHNYKYCHFVCQTAYNHKLELSWFPFLGIQKDDKTIPKCIKHWKKSEIFAR